ncbi:DUF6114 domain-containing protein [Actinoplanes regularis]|uniref:DUF6114 domain-containing protein n=1 Tax=Actinoplanes regularis TaxID=52697 RepID=UPI0024A53C96|nr:DUF6114 domain-containing protein [Actinoplanes regularis]GLW28349.1 hypothetical protein Areg01_12890 [Actinoplanes regularis]
MATDNFGGKFRRWRRNRPFWGGLFQLLSGLFLLLSSNLSVLTDMVVQIHVGPQGFLSYVLPGLMFVCGFLVWFSPGQRMFYGIVGLLTALYSFIGLNFGGWFLGMLFGIVGGALAVSWQPPVTRPGTEPQGPADGSGPGQSAEPGAPGEATEIIQLAGHDDRPHETAQLRPPAVSDPSILPGFEQRPGSGEQPGRGGGINRKALALIIIPAFLGATVLISSRLPASADDCPAGLPTNPATATSATKTATAEPTTTEKPAGTRTVAPAAQTTTPAATPTTTTPAAEAAEEDSSLLEEVVDGVGNLLGLGDDESPSPSASPSASASTATSAEPTATGSTTPAADTTTTSTAATPTSAAASTDPDVIPCLGPRLEGLVADPDGIPTSAIKPGIMKVGSLTMEGTTYEGVADVPTKDGVVKALKFNMTKAVNKPFSLTVDEGAHGVTTVKSNELTTSGNVRFYTTKMTGNLFGVIPVTFTPDAPPPLTPSTVWFTNVTINLNFVRCDTLTGDPLQIVQS